MAQGYQLNFDGLTLFKLKQSESFTVPTSKSSPSPTNGSSGMSPATVFDARRESVGGFLYGAFSDAAGPTAITMNQRLQPGDVVAVSAVVANVATVSINGVAVGTITGVTTVAGVLGAWG